MLASPVAKPANESIALRAFAALECVAAATQPLTLDDITSSLNLPKPTVYRILSLLNGAGLLHRDSASKRYTSGPRLTTFAVDLWRNASLRAPWHRALEIAVQEIGESCNLTLLENNRVLYIDRVECRQALRLHLEIGTRVPLHCTASGKIFLSQMSPEQVQAALGPEPYERFTPHTLTSYRELAAELETTRRTQVGLHDSELFADSVAVAVPIADHRGHFFAAVAMHAPASRASIESAQQYVPALHRAARTIAASMVSSLPQPPASPARQEEKGHAR